MNTGLASCFIAVCSITGGLVGASPAGATLGMGADSVAVVRQSLAARKVTTTNAGRFTVQELTSDATVVREYLAPNGKVYAVAWKGRTHPDLTVLLGSYNARYAAAKAKMPRKHGEKFTLVQAGEVVVESWGHMRNLQGRAYLPALFPEGVDLYEIR